MKAIIPLLIAAASAHAQSVLSVEFSGQPTINTSDGSVVGCGIRFLAIHPTGIKDRFDVVDGSIGVFDNGAVAVKAGVSSATPGGAMLDHTPLMMKPLWFRAEGAPALSPGSRGSFESEDKGFHFFVAELSPGSKNIASILNGMPIWVAFENSPGKSLVYAGPIKLKQPDLDRIHACYSELFARMKKPRQ